MATVRAALPAPECLARASILWFDRLGTDEKLTYPPRNSMTENLDSAVLLLLVCNSVRSEPIPLASIQFDITVIWDAFIVQLKTIILVIDRKIENERFLGK